MVWGSAKVPENSRVVSPVNAEETDQAGMETVVPSPPQEPPASHWRKVLQLHDAYLLLRGFREGLESQARRWMGRRRGWGYQLRKARARKEANVRERGGGERLRRKSPGVGLSPDADMRSLRDSGPEI